jgi:photosystem II stability/assembly factor-like uncharacterized protein
MDPEAPLARRAEDAVVLVTADGGKSWDFRLFERFGQIARARWTAQGPLLLVQRPDLPEAPSRLVALEMPSWNRSPLYVDKTRWLTDLALLPSGRLLAVAIEQQGASPIPSIPARVVALARGAAGSWTEIAVDYRAEARRVVLAVAPGGQAWMATDTGMILKLVD